MGNTFCCSWSPCKDQNDITMIIKPEVQDMDHVDALIDYIDQLLSKIETGGQQQVAKSNTVAASINSGGNLIEKLSRPLNCHVCKKCLLSALHRETRKVVFDVLNQSQHIPCVGMALSVIAHMLERAEQTSSNKGECLQLLHYMSTLVKHMKNLDIHLQRRKLNDILVFIVQGTLMCALQMEPNRFCRFFFAPLDAADLENLQKQLMHWYPDLQLEALTEILNRENQVLRMQQEVLDMEEEILNREQEVLDRLPMVPHPSQGEYPHDAVGVEEAQNKVMALLNLKDQSRRVVVIHGLGGIGKTTLASAVFNCLPLTGYHHCRVDIDQDCRQSELQAMQEQILRDVFKENLELNNCTQGREKLREAFGKASKPVFLFLDNVLREEDLEMLLPIEQLSRLPMLSRILVTTRDLNDTNTFQQRDGIEFHSHMVEIVSKPEAKRILCHYALGDKNGSFDSAVNIDGLLQICGGIPFVLKIVGSELRQALRKDENIVSACNNMLQFLKKWQQEGFEGGKAGLSERIVDFVYRKLSAPCKEAFLDIAFFFHDWERSKVSYIFGEVELQELEGAALVTRAEEEIYEYYSTEKIWPVKKTVVKMHDIVRARGRKLSERQRIRINDRDSLSILLSDKQKLQQTKGIWLDGDDLSLEAQDVDATSTSLQVLFVGVRTRVNGRCERAFQNLRFLHIWYEDMLPIDLTHSNQLTYFHGRRISEARHTINLPQSLRLLYLDAHSPNFGGSLSTFGRLQFINFHYPPVSFDIYGQFTSLIELQLCNITFENLETSIRAKNFSCLKILRLYASSKLERFPESFGNLSSLQELEMFCCAKLERLPESFGNLSSMQRLNMADCSKLERLPESFGNLSYLKELYMSDCSKLERLPESFGNLSSMRRLHMIKCSRLERLPESFGNLSSLQILYMRDSSELERLPDSFGNLSSLQELHLVGGKKMCSLSDNFGQLKFLKFLNLSNCTVLKRLPPLSSLVALTADRCPELEAKTIDNLVEINSLLFLEMGESPMLIKRWEEIKQQHRPLIGAALWFEHPYEEILSTMLFNGGSRFVHVDGDGQLVEVPSSSFPDAGVKVGLISTPCALSAELKQKLEEVASREFQIIYVDVDVEEGAEGEREKRIRETLEQLPEGSRAWTSGFRKTTLLFAYSLWKFTDGADSCIVGTSVVVDEDGTRKLSHKLKRIFVSGGHDSRRADLNTLFSPLDEAWTWIHQYIL